ncbi:MAG: polyvinylalcohol dehydrogenase, partial [Planctomycetota bacterium]
GEERGTIEDGSVIYADGHLYLFGQTESQVALVEASGENWTMKGSFTLPETSEQRAPGGRSWTHPVIAGGRLYLRDQELLYSFEIK